MKPRRPTQPKAADLPNRGLPPDWVRRVMADSARHRKAQRRFIAHQNALWGYHPLHQEQSAMPNWWVDLVVDPTDNDGPTQSSQTDDQAEA